MLFLLTGSIQTGKTRWLMDLLDSLKERGIESYGVVTPGRWERCSPVEKDERARGPLYMKQGIDAVLLPEEERITFATRRDLVAYDNTKPNISRTKGLGWHIFDEAIEHVNSHLEALSTRKTTTKGLLVIDELGKLELENGIGLVQALALLKQGPNELYSDALIVVRSSLFSQAEELVRPAWETIQPLRPDFPSAAFVLSTLVCKAQPPLSSYR